MPSRHILITKRLLNESSEGNIIDESKSGIARELARMNLTLNTYTQWYWKIDLNNLLHFLALRADDHAQYEIRVYADAMLDIVKKWVPLTYEAFEDYRIGGTELSAKEVNLMRKLLKGRKYLLKKKVCLKENGANCKESLKLVSIC